MDAAPWVWDVLRAFRMWRQGTLPKGGGWLDQAPAFVEAMECLLAHQARTDRMDRE